MNDLNITLFPYYYNMFAVNLESRYMKKGEHM